MRNYAKDNNPANSGSVSSASSTEKPPSKKPKQVLEPEPSKADRASEGVASPEGQREVEGGNGKAPPHQDSSSAEPDDDSARQRKEESGDANGNQLGNKPERKKHLICEVRALNVNLELKNADLAHFQTGIADALCELEEEVDSYISFEGM